MVTHGHNLGNDRLARPLDPKYLGQLLEVVGCRLSDREDGVSQPAHAEVAQLLIKELYAKLAGKEGDVLDDSQSNTPLLILSELNDGRKE